MGNAQADQRGEPLSGPLAGSEPPPAAPMREQRNPARERAQCPSRRHGSRRTGRGHGSRPIPAAPTREPGCRRRGTEKHRPREGPEALRRPRARTPRSAHSSPRRWPNPPVPRRAARSEEPALSSKRQFASLRPLRHAAIRSWASRLRTEMILSRKVPFGPTGEGPVPRGEGAFATYPTSSSRSTRFKILPVALRGSGSVRRTTEVGTLNGAMCSRRKACTSSTSSRAPGLG